MAKYIARVMDSAKSLDQAGAQLKVAGDTIVEVLISIAVAAFAIGISYATANRSLQQAQTAAERNQALSVIENQLSDLKLRYQKMSNFDFNSTFGHTTVSGFCLDDSATDPTATNWAPITNYSGITPTSPLAAAVPPTSSAPYNNEYFNTSGDNGCHEQTNGTDYYINIATKATTAIPNPTNYQVTVRWYRLGGQTNQASIYYRF